MKKKISTKKLVLFIGLVFLLLGTFSTSGYYYMINRYSGQIVAAVESVLEGFSEEELESLINNEDLKLSLAKWQNEKADLKNPAEEENASYPEAIANGASDSGSEINLSANPEITDEINQDDDTLINEAPGRDGEDDDYSSPENDNTKKNAQELSNNTDPVVDSSLANKINIRDQLFMAQMYRRFSAAERENLLSLYKEGGNGSLIREVVQSRLSSDEIERVLEISLNILN